MCIRDRPGRARLYGAARFVACRATFGNRARRGRPIPPTSDRQQLREAPQADAEVLLAGLARMLDAHMGRGHDDVVSNRRIRDQLDNIELLMALEIERAGVRQTPVPAVSRAA